MITIKDFPPGDVIDSFINSTQCIYISISIYISSPHKRTTSENISNSMLGPGSTTSIQIFPPGQVVCWRRVVEHIDISIDININSVNVTGIGQVILDSVFSPGSANPIQVLKPYKFTKMGVTRGHIQIAVIIYIFYMNKNVISSRVIIDNVFSPWSTTTIQILPPDSLTTRWAENYIRVTIIVHIGETYFYGPHNIVNGIFRPWSTAPIIIWPPSNFSSIGQ